MGFCCFHCQSGGNSEWWHSSLEFLLTELFRQFSRFRHDLNPPTFYIWSLQQLLPSSKPFFVKIICRLDLASSCNLPTTGRQNKPQMHWFPVFVFRKSFLILCFLKKILLIWKAELEKWGETKGIFLLLVYFPNDCDGWCWVRTKQWIRNFFRVSHIGARGPRIWAILYCFPRCISRKLDGKWTEQPGQS